MTREEFDIFLLCSAGLCVLMALVNLSRAKSRGTSAFLLCGAFLAVAGCLLLYRAGAEVALVTGLGVVAFLLLVGDFMVRAKNQVIERSKK